MFCMKKLFCLSLFFLTSLLFASETKEIEYEVYCFDGWLLDDPDEATKISPDTSKAFYKYKYFWTLGSPLKENPSYDGSGERFEDFQGNSLKRQATEYFCEKTKDKVSKFVISTLSQEERSVYDLHSSFPEVTIFSKGKPISFFDFDWRYKKKLWFLPLDTGRGWNCPAYEIFFEDDRKQKNILEFRDDVCQVKSAFHYFSDKEQNFMFLEMDSSWIRYKDLKRHSKFIPVYEACININLIKDRNTAQKLIEEYRNQIKIAVEHELVDRKEMNQRNAEGRILANKIENRGLSVFDYGYGSLYTEFGPGNEDLYKFCTQTFTSMIVKYLNSDVTEENPY